SWVELFRRVPPNLHDGMILTMTTGGEVVVQKLMKLDPDVAILRGRMAGTQDSGRIILLPYTQLIAINFTRKLSESDVQAIFGKNTQTFAANITLTGVGDKDEKAAEGGEEEAAPNDAADPAEKSPSSPP